MPNYLAQDAPAKNQPGKAITEGQARRFFLGYRWPNHKKACPRCGSEEVREVRRHRLLCATCHYEFGDFTGTYLARMHVGFKKSLELLQFFELEWPAAQAARELGLSYPTVSRGFQIIRIAIAAQRPDLQPGRGERRERAASGGNTPEGKRRDHQIKGPVFGVREESDRVRVEEVPALRLDDLAGLKLRLMGRTPVVYTSRFHDYHSLMFCLGGGPGGDSAHASLRSKRQAKTLPGFLGYARERFVKLHGISWEKFPLYLKELEFRYNHRDIVNSFTIIAGYMAQLWQNLYNPPDLFTFSLINLDKDWKTLLSRV